MASPSQTRTPDILRRIVGKRRRALVEAQRITPIAKLEERAATAPPARDFARAVSRQGINIIAELKKASPSRGVLRSAYNPALLAPALEEAGAVALSVLTEPDFFLGALEDLQVVRKVSNLPLLRKDFLLDPYQLYEARAAGADAFLLIAAVLSPAEMRRLLTLGRQLGMGALVEVHTAAELEQALAAEAEVIGVNNRDLKTFEVNVEISLRLVEAIPEECVAVSESGLGSRKDLERLRGAGFDAFLIGEHLMQAPEPDRALRHLLSGEAL